MAEFERLEVPEFGEGPCANPSCPDQATTPTMRLFDHDIPTLCPRCLIDSEETERVRERQDRLELLMGRSGRTKRMACWSLASYPADGAAMVQRARTWLAAYRVGQRPNLFVYGPAGRGKTGLAWGIVRELIEADLVDARLVNWRDLLQRMQESFDEFGPRLTTDEIRRTQVLCLDDIGSETPTDWRRSELATLIEARYQEMLPTIFTSNYGLRELGDRLGRDDPQLGERLVSRIADGALTLNVAGRDRRLPPPSPPSSGPARQG